jgi:hypothetical protein
VPKGKWPYGRADFLAHFSDSLIVEEQPATKRTAERQDSFRSSSQPPEEPIQSAIVAAASFAISSGSVVMPRFGTGKHLSSDHKHVSHTLVSLSAPWRFTCFPN